MGRDLLLTFIASFWVRGVTWVYWFYGDWTFKVFKQGWVSYYYKDKTNVQHVNLKDLSDDMLRIMFDTYHKAVKAK